MHFLHYTNVGQERRVVEPHLQGYPVREDRPRLEVGSALLSDSSQDG